MPSEHQLLDIRLSLPDMIESELATKAYIDGIDMGMLKQRLMRTEGWTALETDRAERRYKDWLFLVRKNRSKGERLPPPPDIDAVWHGHILDSIAYHRDSNAIFGTYLHHSPYLGERGPADQALLDTLLQNTKLRWLEEYGETL